MFKYMVHTCAHPEDVDPIDAAIQAPDDASALAIVVSGMGTLDVEYPDAGAFVCRVGADGTCSTVVGTVGFAVTTAAHMGGALDVINAAEHYHQDWHTPDSEAGK